MWSTAFGAINTRHALLTRIPMLLILVLIPFIVKRNMGERKNNIKILYNILIIFIILRYSPLINNNVFRYDEVHSDWKKYSKFYKAKSWTLPIYPFFIMENQKGYYIGKETGKILDFIHDEKILSELMKGNKVELSLSQDYFLALGDNTEHSFDSRMWGFVAKDRIRGKALVRFWPLNRIGLISEVKW